MLTSLSCLQTPTQSFFKIKWKTILKQLINPPVVYFDQGIGAAHQISANGGPILSIVKETIIKTVYP